MKLLNNISIIISLIILISCAKQSTPMGGPQDEEPPKLIRITPTNESLNVKPNTIELEFDEYVKVENANKNIIITPRIKKEEMVVVANKNRITIKLNQELEDSTTYVFNFQKSVTDITEQNSPENLKLVFSTGPSIDSLIFSGNVAYTFPQKEKNIKDVLVGLYAVGDTTDVLTAPPYYIGQADSTGSFTITNIKEGNYRAYAWHDANNSLKAEPKSEAYGFIGDTIAIQGDVSGVKFLLSKSDIVDFKVNRTPSVGQNFDIVLSKFPVDIDIEHPDINTQMFYRRNETTIRLYHKTLRNDSTQIRLKAIDSVGFVLDTMLYAKFEESERNKENLEPTIEGPKTFIENLKAELKFNKPIESINFDSLMIKYDSASFFKIKAEQVYLKDSSNRTRLSFDIPIPDTLSKETFTLFASDSTFTDVEGATHENKIESNYKRLKRETLADALRVKVNTTERPLIIQILNQKNEIIAEQYLEESNEATFRNLEPATYQVRAILDKNRNRRWDTSNLLENRQAELVYYMVNPDNSNSRDVILKGGWENEITIEPIQATGVEQNKPLEKPTKELINTETEGILPTNDEETP